ncbi:hypothetical protein VNO77_04064 [Canavalia gladiata]|uniref:Uncharacterized protein n=1 Tax=Canavalia gladiata TaxID=3824 RepID=A0AAN9RCT9_CANGL
MQTWNGGILLGPQDIEVGSGAIPIEEAIRILVSSYKSSERYQAVQNEVAVLSQKDTSSIDTKKGHAGFLNQCFVFTKRSLVSMYLDLGHYWLRFASKRFYDQNAKCMKAGADRMCMPSPSIDLFINALKQTVLANKCWVPPPGRGSLYIRPLLTGKGAVLGLAPAPEYTFVSFYSPVGNYHKVSYEEEKIQLNY